MSATSGSTALRLGSFIDRSPSPFHACSEVAAQLDAAGFRRLSERDPWGDRPGGAYVVRSGSLVAWRVPVAAASPATPFRIAGAHTDSPNLRVKPRPDRTQAGFRQLGVEIYGGVLLNSWLDRDLGLSGRVFLRNEASDPDSPAGADTTERVFRIDRPVLRVPQLAIHLHRELHSEGLKLDKQRHMAPVWGTVEGDERSFRDLLGIELGVAPERIVSWDAMCHDLTPCALLGFDADLLAAPRLDNLASCFCALDAFLAAQPADLVTVISFFDHEEVGSESSSGAGSPLLKDVLERTVLARGGGREDLHRALASSVCVSADMAHGTHPNYIEKHEPEHLLYLNRGPVIKLNANLRYASDSESEALFQRACEVAEVPFQKWVNRTDLACGSTIGPITAAGLGMRVVDVGLAQLSMHSARELCGASDPDFMIRAMGAFFVR